MRIGGNLYHEGIYVKNLFEDFRDLCIDQKRTDWHRMRSQVLWPDFW